MVHHSVKPFLLSDYRGQKPFSLSCADQRMAGIVVTYLNYEVFSKQVSSLKTPEIHSESINFSVLSAVGFFRPGPLAEARSEALENETARR
ncbi:hypothetical protein BDV11DRAFT_143001 [Aspergillus similis]